MVGLDDPGLVLLPTGPGEARSLAIGALHALKVPGSWSSGAAADDPGSLFFLARDGDGPERMYRLPLAEGGSPRAITPPELALAPRGHVVSTGGRRLIVQPVGAAALVFDLTGDGEDREGRPVAGASVVDRVMISTDGAVYVYSIRRVIPTLVIADHLGQRPAR